jgi:peptide/nickel transport system ATP-binding protein
MLLEIDDLRIEGLSDRGWQPVVKGVSLRLARGEVMGLIGESGAGKSTIGLASLGYVRPGCRFTGGSVRLDGKDLLELPERELLAIRGKRVAYVAQSAAAAFNPAHRLIDQINEVAMAHGMANRAEMARRAVELFRRLGLPSPESFGQRYPHQVSGGQLQRAMTVMALIARPDLVVFDEPTTALDVTTQIEVLAAIRKAIREEHTAALYITHDLAVVAQVADRIMVLRHGATVEEGPTAQILNAPREEYTRRLVNVRRMASGEAANVADPVLEVRGVTAAYGDALVLEEVSLELLKGQTLAIVGESGSGKSTLARVITGLLPPRQGEIRYRGRPLPPPLGARSKDLLREIQMIYQLPDIALNPRQTVAEIVGRPVAFYFGTERGRPRQRVIELLQQIELDPVLADRYPGELSGGQKQRVCIARALAAEPDIIICDEPTSALDPLVADGILELLLRLQRQTGVALLFITHDLATVKAIAHAVVVMQRGRIVDSGPKEDILRPPHHPYTELLLASVPEMRTDWLDGVLARRLAA